MRKMARSTARKMAFTGLLLTLGLAFSATPVFARSSHARGPATVKYFSTAEAAVSFPNGEDNPNASPRIASCDPANATGTIHTTLVEGGPGLPLSYYPNRAPAYRVYAIHLSAQTQIWVSGDAGKPYMVKSLCPLQEYDPEGNNETTYKDLSTVTFTFAAPHHKVKAAQQLFNEVSPTKVLFYVSGDVNP